MIRTTEDLRRALPNRHFDLSRSLEEVIEEIPFIGEFVTYYNHFHSREDLCFNPQNCKFIIKSTQDLIKANAFRTPTLKFVKKIPLKNLCFRLDIGAFVTQWNDTYEKNISRDKSESIDLDKLLNDKVLLDRVELQIERLNATNIDIQDDGRIKVVEEEIDDLMKERSELKKEIKEKEPQASIIRRQRLIDSLKKEINYGNIKY